MTEPDPLVSADCDCRGLPFMPLEVSRLRESDLAALSTGDEFKAAVMLWCASWTQAPAASLPDDDRILARLAGYSLQEWMGLREMALRGWVKCSDGRFYHPLIADHAVSAFEKRRGQKAKADSRWAKAKKGASSHGTCPGIESGMPQHALKDATASATAMQGTGTDNNPPLPPEGDPAFGLEAEQPAKPDEVQVAFDEWNALATRIGLPMARALSDDRRRAIQARLKVGGLELWRDALKAVEASAFLRGQRPGSGGQPFKADLAFVCQAKSFSRLIDGGYGQDARDEAPATSRAPPQDPWPRRIKEWRQNAHWNRLDWGPPPGKPGCAVPPEILMAHGYVPTPIAGAAA